MAGQIIAIDWDHTIWNHTTNGPMEGVHEAFDAFRESGHQVWIFSCNNPAWIRQMCEEHNLRPHGIWGEDGAKGKIVSALYIDDRAMQFKSWSKDAIDEMLARVEGRPVRQY